MPVGLTVYFIKNLKLIYERYLENYHLSKPNVFGRVEGRFEFIHIDVRNVYLILPLNHSSIKLTICLNVVIYLYIYIMCSVIVNRLTMILI